MNKSRLELTFPFGGINKNAAQWQQVPLTSPAMANVRPCDSIQSRIRGGQRPGLKKQYQTCIGSGKPVIAMAEVTVVEVS